MAEQLNLFDVMPPADTIPIRLRDGELISGTVGPRSSLLPIPRKPGDWFAKTHAWLPDPHGEYFLVSWVEPPSRARLEFCQQLNLPCTAANCGLYFRESTLRHLLGTDTPYDHWNTRYLLPAGCDNDDGEDGDGHGPD